MPLLKIDKLTMRFGGLTAVSGLDLEVAAGTIDSIIGPNGAGKTTLFNVLTGLLRADSGAVVFRGIELTALSPHQVVAAGATRVILGTAAYSDIDFLRGLLYVQNQDGNVPVISTK